MRVNLDQIRLRPASAADEPFLRRVHEAAMRPHVERAWGAWDGAEQRRRFAATTDPATHEVIEAAGIAVGCQWVRRHADALELVRLWLLPEAQGQGIGTHLVRLLCARARADGLPVRLRVLRSNPARNLYGRLGFAVVGETESHLQMEHPGR